MRTLQLLIVEDDPKIAEIQRRFVERLEAVELSGIAHSLEEARDLLDVLQPDLMLLDVYFPEGDGLDLLRDLRAANSATDVILITAAREVETVRSALRGGVFDYILKPLVFSRLQDAVSKYRQHLDKLDSMQQVEQRAVDALLPHAGGEGVAHSGSSDRLPKGIDGITLDKIRAVVFDQGTWSAEGVGQEIGASRTTARRYLEYLVTTGELEAEVNYGTVGRPERRYHMV